MNFAPRAFIAATLAAAGMQATAADFTMRISHPLPPTHHIAKVVEQFASDVKTNTGGKVQVQIFGADQLFKANQNHAAVARGQVEAAMVTNFQWGQTIPEINVMSIPYLMGDMDGIKKFPGSEASRLLNAKMEEKGVTNIAWLYTTRQAVFTSNKAPLVNTSDFKGVKVRGLSKMVDRGLEAVGAAPATMPAAEVYQALQTGVIDAGLTDVSAAYSRRFYEVQKYATVTPFFVVYYQIFVNPSWWKALPADVRAGVEKAAAKAEVDSIPATETAAAEALVLLKERGMTLTLHTPAQAAAFSQAMQPPVREEFLKSSPDAKKLMDLLKSN